MKKLLLLLFVLAIFQVNAQNETLPSNLVSNVFYLTAYDYDGLDNAVTVPQGKFWTVFFEAGDWYWKFPEEAVFPVDRTYDVYINATSGKTILAEGYRLFSTTTGAATIGILEHNFGTDEALSYNDVEPIKDTIKLFPNPTTNELALNSDKVYQIEVFDLSGNKVMEFKGNSINVEHLSSATYIVNAIDLETNESLSYKVIKN